VGIPQLTQVDSTEFNLVFRTDSLAVITVHVAEDSTYQNAFIFLGRTTGTENDASIKMEGLKNNRKYLYRIFIGQKLTLFSGAFSTGIKSESSP